ncbi:hypothetical protein [Evansella halocellulosilytica]|uniref:hypothetical protein n=1 Tax=Evansella halocellulosilytica TaxID=2011013 RepID=UPI000BB991B6
MYQDSTNFGQFDPNQDERVIAFGGRPPRRRPHFYGRRSFYPAPFFGGVLGGLLGSALFSPYYGGYYPPYYPYYPPYYPYY